eukprot:CAMPEP_0196719096 /NCGR_PEP_ID=MMETSP1091-20130531/2159_1 /TAXON_ID=302021 /ORGANISM="Rhodomonas sp., Strain CCMP768" /LENGTH=42 /DNA_ID= /DNA_START= /DNA_END= /DNA_ORIENTATION=
MAPDIAHCVVEAVRRITPADVDAAMTIAGDVVSDDVLTTYRL